MPFCLNKQHTIHYDQYGIGNPVVLIHGGAASFETNYAAFGWVERLNESGLQVIGLDIRGHGKSGRPLDTQSYGTENLASDVLAVMGELGLEQFSVVGYSLGSAVALHLAHANPERVTKAVLVATGDGLLGFPPHTFEALLPAITDVMSRSEYPKDLPSYIAAYWNLVANSGGSRKAVSTAAAASYPALSEALAANIAVPTLVVSGDNDSILGQGPRLAAALGNGRYLEIKAADHFNLALLPEVKNVIAEFLA